MYVVDEAILAIKKWKAHIIRSQNQEGARTALVNQMTDEDVLVTCDLAMKYLPRKYREGPCDRRAAHIKGVIKRHINEGTNVTTALEMKQALGHVYEIDLKVKVVSTVNIVDVKPAKVTIPDISSLYNFKYNSDGLRVLRAFSIGEGKMLHWGVLGSPTKCIELTTVLDWEEEEIEEESVSAAEGNKQEVAAEQPSKAFQCPEDNCTRTFSTQKAADTHILLGNCSLQGSKMITTEKAKHIYADKLHNMFPSKEIPHLLNPKESVISTHKALVQGWAVKGVKRRTTFNDKQKEILQEKFNIGKVTGNKVDPFAAEQEMRLSGKFTRHEFLSGQQISSYFSRFYQLEKKTSSEDYESAVLEDRKDAISSKITKVLSSQY